MFPTYQFLQKGQWDFFIFFRSWVNKSVKHECVEIRYFLQITQDLNKIKKNPTQPFVDIGK